MIKILLIFSIFTALNAFASEKSPELYELICNDVGVHMSFEQLSASSIEKNVKLTNSVCYDFGLISAAAQGILLSFGSDYYAGSKKVKLFREVVGESNAVRLLSKVEKFQEINRLNCDLNDRTQQARPEMKIVIKTINELAKEADRIYPIFKDWCYKQQK